MEAFILAGGKGTRLRYLVNDRPKPMADIGGKPFLEHLLTHYKKKEITHFILSTGYKKETIKNYFGSSFSGSGVESQQSWMVPPSSESVMRQEICDWWLRSLA